MRGGVIFFRVFIFSEWCTKRIAPLARLYHYKTPIFAAAGAATHQLSNNHCYDLALSSQVIINKHSLRGANH